MKLRNIAALLLCFALLFTAACGATEDPETSPTPSASAAAPGEIDFAAAYAAYDPNTVMMTVGGISVTWDLLYFFLATSIDEVIYYTGVTPDLTESEDGLSYREQIISRAMDGLLAYKSVEAMANEANVTLSADAIAEMQLERENEVAQNGGETAFVEYLNASNMSEAVYTYLKTVQYLFKCLITEAYGEDAVNLPDAEALEAVAGQDWLMAKHILISTRHDNSDGTYTDYTAEEKAVALEHANAIIGQLTDYDGDDFDVFFDELMFDNSADTGGLLGYPDGYLFTAGAMMEEFEQGTRDLEIGAFAAEPAETIYGYHIIYRLPLDLDSVPTSASITLREIAAQSIVSYEAEEVYNSLSVENTPEYDAFDIAQVFKAA